MKTSYAKYAKIRDDRGLTDYKVARDTGIGASTISDWKNNISAPKTDKLFILARYLGVRAEDILEDV